MFASALKNVSVFTKPVIISKRLHNNEIICSCATFVIINPEGYILTSAHVTNDLFLAEQHKKEQKEFNEKVEKIKNNINLNSKKKKNKLSSLKENPEWIINLSYWWGNDQYNIKNITVDKEADLALVKLEPFDQEDLQIYPVFINPDDELLTGTSLCRLGFPFHNINATFDESSMKFTIAPGTLPMTRFPNEGIHTRVKNIVYPEINRDVKFIETSSPGLMGQSGGPIFDIKGNIWALQSHTGHFNLGFSPKVLKGKKEIEEHQFLNVGLGTHVEEIVRMFKDKNVSFKVS